MWPVACEVTLRSLGGIQVVPERPCYLICRHMSSSLEAADLTWKDGELGQRDPGAGCAAVTPVLIHSFESQPPFTGTRGPKCKHSHPHSSLFINLKLAGGTPTFMQIGI